MSLFEQAYHGKRVFVTGHTGFKGSWMVAWLEKLGAQVTGFALDPYTTPNHLGSIDFQGEDIRGDIRNLESLSQAIKKVNPDIVFHMAAQPLVRESYRDPIDTFSTNVIGTANVLEACRTIKNLKAIVSVTTDKVYENEERNTGYTESDRLGGHDPYSASKACAELVTASYRNAFFNLSSFEKEHKTLIATARGGNVVGGGDWSDDRIVPDIVRAQQSNEILEIRSPKSIRPWQHVLDCLAGYLLLGSKLLAGNKEFAEAWNFGPEKLENITVGDIVERAGMKWPNLRFELTEQTLHETQTLQLDCSKAKDKLEWQQVLSPDELFDFTFDWYQNFQSGAIDTNDQINAFCALAKERNAIWA